MVLVDRNPIEALTLKFEPRLEVLPIGVYRGLRIEVAFSEARHLPVDSELIDVFPVCQPVENEYPHLALSLCATTRPRRECVIRLARCGYSAPQYRRGARVCLASKVARGMTAPFGGTVPVGTHAEAWSVPNSSFAQRSLHMFASFE